MGIEMKKIAVHLPTYGRHDECLMTFAGLKRMRDVLAEHDILLVVFPIVSNYDDHEFVKQNQGYFTIGDLVVADNSQLGEKFNLGLFAILSYAAKHGCDYMLTMGSDNLLSQTAINYILHGVETQQIFWGFNHVLMYDKVTARAVAVKYSVPSGVGRMHAISMLDKACRCEVAIAKKSLTSKFGAIGKGQQCYLPTYSSRDEALYEYTGRKVVHLWPDDTRHSTDLDSERWLMYNSYNCRTIKTDRPVILDVKGESNLSPFSDFWDNPKHERAEVNGGEWPEIKMI